MDQVHRMIVLGNNTDPVLSSADGIPSVEALDYVSAGLARHNAIHVAFVFSYDVNMMLRDLPRERIIELWNDGKTKWRHWSIQYIPRKSFGLWSKDGNRLRGGMVWDVFGFCQSSFVEALKKYNVGTKEQIERIEKMKKQRRHFKASALPKITAYMQEECVLLAEGLAPAIRDSFDAAGIRLSRFDGAGAAASALMRREKVDRHLKSLPPAVELAARHGYFGGHIECMKYGNLTSSKVYGYDINSAYPAAALAMPSLREGRWVRRTKFCHGFGIWRLRWDFDTDVMLPLPWRSRQGAIYYPATGEGWYWAPEAEAALTYARKWSSYCDVLDGWLFVPTTKERPFRFLQVEYDRRRKWKAEGNGAEKAAKLAINSVYGKLAQQVGMRPRWHNLAYAGWITSTTRAALWNATQQAPNDVLMVATDAVYSLSPLKLPLGDKLGEWEASEYVGATIVQSGVYWLGDGEIPKGRRGFDLRSLSRSGIINAWKKGNPEFPAQQTAFVGMGEVVSRNAWGEWCTWQQRKRMLALDPTGTKRYPTTTNLKLAARGLLETLPVTPLVRDRMSAPIVRPWDEGETTRDEFEVERRLIEESEAWAD